VGDLSKNPATERGEKGKENNMNVIKTVQGKRDCDSSVDINRLEKHWTVKKRKGVGGSAFSF